MRGNIPGVFAEAVQWEKQTDGVVVDPRRPLFENTVHIGIE